MALEQSPAPAGVRMIRLSREPQRILIVKPSALGDIVHTLPILQLLRRRFPAAQIDWLVVPAFASLLDGHPLLNSVIRFDRKRFAGWYRSAATARELIAFHRRLRQSRYDLAIDLQGLFRSGWLTWASGAADRVGFAYAREGAPLFYNHRVPTETHEKHAVERYLDIAEALGCGRGPVTFDFGIDDAVRAATAELVGEGRPYAVLLPGTNWATKRWPAENYAALVEPIAQRFGLRTIIAGGGDVAGIEFPGAQSLAGKTDLKQLVALLEKADLVIANDSGPMHIAAALNRPLVTLFGPTNAVRTGPYARMETVLQLDLVCRPCYSRTCVHTSCLQWITPPEVIATAQGRLALPVLPGQN
ncbi:MAG: lipopolysaccharide heptosyltransferase I [Tepidisphaeraceae bacterium]